MDEYEEALLILIISDKVHGSLYNDDLRKCCNLDEQSHNNIIYLEPQAYSLLNLNRKGTA